MRAKFIFEWFPPLIEEELSEVYIKKHLTEYEEDMLKDEVGKTLFGELYNPSYIGNAQLPSRYAGYLGKEVKKWKDVITTEKITKKSVLSKK